MMEFTLKPIGIIHSPFKAEAETPIQPSRSTARGLVEVYPEYVEGLQDIEGFTYLFLLYAFDRSSGYQLVVRPFLDDQVHGLFATRYPRRPNPLGLSVVRLVTRQNNRLEIEGVDVLDGTPLLDLKPYVPEFDARIDAQVGWLAKNN